MYPDSQGSLGIAISEAMEIAAEDLYKILSGKRAQSRCPASNRDRPGSFAADGNNG